MESKRDNEKESINSSEKYSDSNKKTGKGKKKNGAKISNRNRLFASSILAVKEQNKRMNEYMETLNGETNDESNISFNERGINLNNNSLKPFDPDLNNKYLLGTSEDISSLFSEDDWREKHEKGSARRAGNKGESKEAKTKAKKVITKPVVLKQRVPSKEKKKPVPPKENPPARRSRLSSACSPSLTSENFTLKTNPPKEEDQSKIRKDSSLHEPLESPPKQPHRSPLRKRMSPMRNDEMPVQIDSDDSESPDEENDSEGRLIIGPYYTGSTSGEFKNRKRPPPILVSQKPRSREAKNFNEKLEKRNRMAPKEKLVINMEENKTGEKYTQPSWNMKLKALNHPNDAAYMAKIQSTYSFSSIFNGLKKA